MYIMHTVFFKDQKVMLKRKKMFLLLWKEIHSLLLWKMTVVYASCPLSWLDCYDKYYIHIDV